MQRRTLLRASPALAALALLPTLGTTQTSPSTPSTPALPVLQVWKDPNCGCCKDWITYLERDGFQVQTFDTGNTAMRKRLGLPDRYGSCHTGLIGGYVIEGHVNAREIRRLLAEKPRALGLAVPGMPVSSPGMDGAIYGNRKDAYDVVLVLNDGSSRVYQSYPQHHSATTPPAQTTEPSTERPWAEAEIRRIDAAAGKISLKHGEIKNLDMPPMTMVFQVRDKAQLGPLKPGDRVRFQADKVNGSYTVLAIEPQP